MQYHELHLHDHYSALDGLNTPAEYMTRAAELGMTHLAQTNHGTLSGHREFQRAAKEAGITPILGVEAYISSTDRFDRRSTAKREDGTTTYNHIGLLAMNERGLQNLNILMREAWTGGFYGKPRIDLELLEEYNEDIIILSGCLGGLLASALTTEKEHVPDYELALATANRLKAIAGERFFIEVQGHNPKYINDGLFQIAEETKTLPVITSDCHYACKEDLWIENAMLILSTKPKAKSGFDFSYSQTLDYLERFNYLYPERKMNFEEIEIYLRSATEQAEMLEAQSRGTDAITNTDVVARMIGDYPYYEALDLLPSPDKNVEDLDAELYRQVFEGLAERGLDNDPVYVKRAEDELAIIKQMGFAVYFLILSDIVRWAKSQGIFIGPGRGSGVSSLVNYSLFITNIDPIEYKLLFFRFLDPDRPDWPDVDIDFEVKRRYEVKEYANRKYGHTANIMTFTYFRGKSAIKAAASVFKIPVGEVNKATSTLQEDAEYSVLDVYESSEQTAEFRNKYPEVGFLAREIEGRIRGTGMHAGGTILSKVPIEDYVPMETRVDPQDEAKDRVPLVAVDMKDAADIGLIKMDFLGLNNLTVILEVLEEVGNMTQEDIYDIPLDDPKVYEMLSNGYTRGVFQCEGGPYTKLLVSMGGVDNFEDLVSSNALVRPGAAKSSIGENYIKGKETGEFEYIHADAKSFTQETYGQILFQEQQMLLCTEVAGLTMREANIIRKAISKKILKDLVVWKPAFIEGAAKKIGEKRAAEVWDDLEKSAEYAFNRAHSVGYSMISYWTAWFKVNYPVQYMTALMNHLSGNDVKVKALFYLMEAKRMGISVKLPHVNASEVENRVEHGSIRMGLSSIKFISGKVGSKIVANKPYKSYAHLLEVSKTKGSGINSRAIGAMNKIGAAAFDDNARTGKERDFFYEYLNIPAFNGGDLPPHVKLQFRDLDEYTDDGAFVVCGMVYNIKTGPGWALVEMMDESGSAGSFAGQDIPVEKGQMYVMLINNNRIARYATTEDVMDGKAGALGKYLDKDTLDLKDGEFRCLAYRTRTTKARSRMADAVFTDRDKNLISAMVFESMLDKATVPCSMNMKVKAKFAQTRNGGTFLRDIR